MVLSCHDMKKGQVYRCESCGFEMKITNSCKECCEDGSCGCSFQCCGKDLKLKK